jgi:putative ubiquitin-RnfH superfamily antitoxin RatB of RatAB toxin-antitoxin module
MSISIEVVYALPDEQRVVTLSCEQPVTIEQAIRQSGILEAHPEIALEDDMVGVFGHRCALNHLLEDEDRVEIYRPLYMSPTEARKMRAASRKKRQNRD